VPIELDPTLAPPVVPLAWLVGTWAGVGVVGYPTVNEAQFGQEVTFRHDGRAFLHYVSESWLLDEAGERVRPLASETGYWRPTGPDPTGGTSLEVVLTHPTGIAELYLGRVDGARVDLQTDAVVRSVSAVEYSAGRRMYGMVEGDLLWVLDMAATGHSMQAHASARLRRV